MILYQSKTLSIVALCLLFYSCNNEHEKVNEPTENQQNYNPNKWDEMEWEQTEEEYQESLAERENESVWEYPKVLSSSLRNLQLVQNPWEESSLLCAEDEGFLLIKLVDTEDSVQNLIAISSFERRGNAYDGFYFYHFNLNGKIYSKHLLNDGDYHIQDRNNFEQLNDEILFYVNQDQEDLYKYDLLKHFISKTLNNGVHEFDDSRIIYGEYPSPSKNKTVEFVNNGTTLLCTNKKGKSDTLIAQEYSGSWSFGEVTWSADENKFYFDNSGAVACIWEIDLLAKTIDKIVPEHHAHCPVFYHDKNTLAVLFCENGCVKITRELEH